jgi:hypothetical protein
MYVHNNNKKNVYTLKKTVHWSSTLRIVCIVIFSLSIPLLLIFVCYFTYNTCCMGPSRAETLCLSSSFLSQTFFLFSFVVWWRSNIECMKKLIENLRACVYAYAIISLSLKNIDGSGTSWTWFFSPLLSLNFMSHTSYIPYLCNEQQKLKNKLIQHYDCVFVCLPMCL